MAHCQSEKNTTRHHFCRKGAGHPLRGKSSRSKRTFNLYLPLPQELPDTVLTRNASAKRRAYLLKIAEDLLCLFSRREIWPTAPSTPVPEAHRHRMQTHVLQRAIIVVNHFCDYRLPVLAIGRKPCRVVLRTLAEIVTWQGVAVQAQKLIAVCGLRSFSKMKFASE